MAFCELFTSRTNLRLGKGTAAPASDVDIVRSDSTNSGDLLFPTIRLGNTAATGSPNYATFQVEAANRTVKGRWLADGSTLDANRFIAGTASVITGSVTNHPLGFITNNTIQMVLDTAGNLGIGTTVPTQLLDIRKNQNGATYTRINNTTDGTASITGILLDNGTTPTGEMSLQVFNSSFTTSGLQIASGGRIRISGSMTGGFAFVTGAAAPIIFGINDAEQARFQGTNGHLSLNTISDLAQFGLVASATTIKGIVSRNAASSTANNFEAQNSSGTAYVTIGPDTLSTAGTQQFLNITGTMPNISTSINHFGVFFDITGAGTSTSQPEAFKVNFNAGYTGSSINIAGEFVNKNAGTGNNLSLGTTFSNPTGNSGFNSFVTNTTASALNVGGMGAAEGGISSTSLGLMGKAVTATNSGTNIGIMGVGFNTGTSPIQIGGYFGLQQATPTFASAALLCDNGTTSSPIFLIRNNGVVSFRVNDITNGSVTAEQSQIVSTPGTLVITGGFTTQRYTLFSAPNLNAATALTVTNAATVAIAGAPVAGGVGPATITNNYAFWIQGGNTRFDGTIGIIGAGEAGTPAAYTLRGPSASGINIAGANLTMAASNSTGTGLGGSLLFQVANTTTTGSTSNSLATVFTIAPPNTGTTLPANGLTLTSAIASGTVTLAATGSDTNVPFTISGKGTGNLNLNSTKLIASSTGTISTYNNVATTGWGVPAIYSSGRSTAQTAAVASVAAYTVGAADGSFIVSANVLVTTSTTHNFTVTCAYTDEGNTARTLTFNFSNLAGTLATAIANAGGAVPYEGVPMHIRCKASTSITIATTGTFTTVTYNVEGMITQIA